MGAGHFIRPLSCLRIPTPEGKKKKLDTWRTRRTGQKLGIKEKDDTVKWSLSTSATYFVNYRKFDNLSRFVTRWINNRLNPQTQHESSLYSLGIWMAKLIKIITNCFCFYSIIFVVFYFLSLHSCLFYYTRFLFLVSSRHSFYCYNSFPFWYPYDISFYCWYFFFMSLCYFSAAGTSSFY